MERQLIISLAIAVMPAWFGSLAAGVRGLQLEDVQLIVPHVAEQGDDITMYCNFDPRSTFDSIKWYKGSREFFRYVPKERPQKKVLKMDSLIVDENQSDAHKVLLRNIPVGLTGNISCEVTTDPDYRSIRKYQYLTVIAHSELPPVLTVSPPQTRYLHVGDTLKLRCRSGPTKPAVNFTFLVNNVTHMDSTFRQSDPVSVGNLTATDKNLIFETREAEVELTVTENHFVDNKIRIQCVAGIFKFLKPSNAFEGEMEAPSKPVTSHGYGVGLGRNSGASSQPGIRVVMLAFFLSLLSCHHHIYSSHHHHHQPHPVTTFAAQ